MNKPTYKDWCQVAKETIEDLGLNMTLERIKVMKEEDLKEIVKKACEKKALEFLNKNKEGHSKVLHISHPKWEQQPYLKPNQMVSIDEFIFLLRTRMLDIKTNYRNKYSDVICPICKSADDEQAHLLVCKELTQGTELVDPTMKYENFSYTNLEEILKVSRMIQLKFKRRKDLIKSLEVTHVNR